MTENEDVSSFLVVPEVKVDHLKHEPVSAGTVERETTEKSEGKPFQREIRIGCVCF